MFTLLRWIFFGLIVGAVARFLMPGQDRLGCLGTIGLGVAGSIVGGWLGGMIFGYAAHPAGFLGALIGATLILWAWRRFMATPPPPL